jgi:hypothetical protein
VHVRVPIDKVEERVVLRHPEVRDDRGQRGVAGQHLAEGAWSGEVARHRTAPGVHHDRDTSVGEQPPRRVQHRVPWVEAADLDVQLDDAGALAQGSVDVARHTGLREEGHARYDVVVPGPTLVAGEVAAHRR